jgi:hypothetical protein
MPPQYYRRWAVYIRGARISEVESELEAMFVSRLEKEACQTDPLPHAAMTCHGGSKERTMAVAEPVSGESRLKSIVWADEAERGSRSRPNSPGQEGEPCGRS